MNKLKIVLKKYGVTRVELGKRMGVSHQRITELANKTAFSYPILYRIAKALQVEPGDLLLTLDEINQLSDEEIDDMIPRKRKKSNK